MNSDAAIEAVEKKPRFLSLEWFKNLGSALRFDKYNARDWAIWQLSSWVSYAMVFGLTKFVVPMAKFVVALLPLWLVTSVKVVASTVSTAVVAVWNVAFHAN